MTLQRKRVKRKRSRGAKKPAAVETSPEALEETWKVVEEEVRGGGFQVSLHQKVTSPSSKLRCLQHPLLPQLSQSLTQGLVPFDAASETPLEDQRAEAMVKVQDALLARQGPVALGLLRAARSARWRSSAALLLHLQ